MTPEILTGVAALLLSLVFSYFPKLNTWYAAKPEADKKLIMLGLTALVAASSFGLSCAGYLSKLFDVSLACTQDGAIFLLKLFFTAVVANQVGYSLSPTSSSVKTIKALRDGGADMSVGAR